MSASNIDIGKKGEQLAKEFLLQKGYEFLEANYRFSHLEIDLIFKDKNQLVIVEVKTRNTTQLGEPYEAVTKAKQSQLIRAANFYIEQNEIDLDCRFDVVSIVLFSDGNYRLQHIIDAFVPEV